VPRMMGFTCSELVLIGVASIVCVEGSRRASRMPLEQAEELPQISAKSALLLPLAISAVLVLLYLFFHALETFLVFYVCASSAMAVSFTVWPVVHRLGAVLRPLLSSAAASWLLALAAVGSWLWTGHWLWNNILGSCLCVTMISLVRLPNLRVASLCLGALFVYDVFWVFGSARLFGGKNVMVDVATKSAANPLASMGIGAAAGELQLPFKLMFPSEMGWAAAAVVALSEKSSAAAQAAGASGAVAGALPASSAALGGAADLRDTQAKARAAGAAAAAVAAAAVAGEAAATPSLRTKALTTVTAVSQEAFLMIGLGDIALPGIFLAFARRCDSHARRRYRRLLCASEMGEHGRGRQEKSRGGQRSRPPHPRFFSACLAAYVLGLALAVYCSREWNMAQPALMYLVPAVIGSMVWQARQHAMLRTVWHDVPEQVDRSNADSSSSSSSSSRSCGDGDEGCDGDTTLLAKSG